MKSKRRWNQRGTTLVESMMALTLFGLTATSIGTLLTQQIRMQGWNTYRTNAIALASAELEDLRGLDYSAIPTGNPARTATVQLGGMTYNVSTKSMLDTPASGMKQITVTVTFNEPTGTKTYSLDAIYTSIKK